MVPDHENFQEISSSVLYYLEIRSRPHNSPEANTNLLKTL